MGELEIRLARDARTDPLAFDALADLAEERGEPAEVSCAIRGLRQVALEIQTRMSQYLAEVEGASVLQVQVNRLGGWRVWPERGASVGRWAAEDFRGRSEALEVAIDRYDTALPGLEALGAALGFGVLEALRNQHREVIEIRYARK